MLQLTNLSALDVRNNSNVNNTLLEAAVNLKNRKITIYCNDTSINTIEFEFKYPQTVRVLKEINYYQFKCDNLTFESDITKKNELLANLLFEIYIVSKTVYVNSNLP